MVAANDVLLDSSVTKYNPSDCQRPKVLNKNLVKGNILLYGYPFNFVVGTASIKKVLETAKSLGVIGFVLAVENVSPGTKFDPVPVGNPEILITNVSKSLELIDYYNISTPRDWTGRVRSFKATGNIGDATPFDYGSGHVNSRAALDPGLVFDAGLYDCVVFDPFSFCFRIMPPKRRREADDGEEQDELVDWDLLIKNLVEAMTNFVRAVVIEAQRSVTQSGMTGIRDGSGDGDLWNRVKEVEMLSKSHVRKMLKGDSPHSPATFASPPETSGKVKKACYKCKQISHLRVECPWDRPSSGVCIVCGQSDHRKKDCPKRSGIPVGGVNSGQELIQPSVSQIGVQLGESPEGPPVDEGSKDKALEMFKHYKNEVENQLDKVLRNDRVREYESSFADIYSEQGVNNITCKVIVFEEYSSKQITLLRRLFSSFNPKSVKLLFTGFYFVGYEDYLGFLCTIPGIDAREIKNHTYSPCNYTLGHPSNLNTPSIAISHLVGSQVVTRTVTNVAEEETYVIAARMAPAVAIETNPPAMTVRPGASRKFTVTLTVRSLTGNYAFGEVLMKGSRRHKVRIPVVAMGYQH
ncbi:subtilisin-like protease SBT2.5 [Cornus florida]|uniref:subtilisin-like protease SBT2.5 n=1 Tax=Cornus florida TaxID=4283 RepID=UPI0028A18AC5|nr:subtilisin-like protease SBT2.5 [Cornus florida]